MKNIPVGFPFLATPFRSDGSTSDAGYQQKFAVMNWKIEMGNKKEMIIDTYMGKMKITRKMVDDFLKQFKVEKK